MPIDDLANYRQSLVKNNYPGSSPAAKKPQAANPANQAMLNEALALKAKLETKLATAEKVQADSAKAAADRAAAATAAANKAAADKANSTPLKVSTMTTNVTPSYSVNPVPYTPTTSAIVVSPPPPPTKTAPIDTVLFNDDSVSIEIMTDLIFEDIGGHELINIARNDIVNGQRVSYTPIKNLGLIQQRYNPNNILSLQLTSEKYFNNFSIKLEEKVPKEGNGIDGSNIYFDEATGDLIVETVNMNPDEQLEVQISINGTIYEANFGEITS